MSSLGEKLTSANAFCPLSSFAFLICTLKGFIDFIVKPSLDVCGELLDKIYTQSMGLCSSADSLVSDSEEASSSNRRRHKHHKSSQLKPGETGDRGGASGGKIRPKSLTSLILDKSVSLSPLKKHLSPSSDAAGGGGGGGGGGGSESNTGSRNNSNNNSNNSSSNNNNNKPLSDSVAIESTTATSATCTTTTTATATGSSADPPHQEVTKDKYRLTTTATGAVSSSSPVADAPASQAAVRYSSYSAFSLPPSAMSLLMALCLIRSSLLFTRITIDSTNYDRRN